MVSLGWAQEWTGRLPAVREHALESDFSYRFLSRLCHTVSPRLSGSPAATAGVDLVEQEMRRLDPGKSAGVPMPVALTTLGGSSSTGDQGVENNSSWSRA